MSYYDITNSTLLRRANSLFWNIEYSASYRPWLQCQRFFEENFGKADFLPYIVSNYIVFQKHDEVAIISTNMVYLVEKSIDFRNFYSKFFIWVKNKILGKVNKKNNSTISSVSLKTFKSSCILLPESTEAPNACCKLYKPWEIY